MTLLAFALTLLYWVEPHAEADLAHASMRHWQNASAGALILQPASNSDAATLRFRWITPRSRGLYGQSVAREQNGRRVFELVINPALAARESDPLLAATILFLTCVHEAGHALGLEHTSNFADIMYSFQYGGDLEEYFARYRRKLQSRRDIQRQSPLSPGDVQQLLSVLGTRTQNENRSAGSSPSPPR